MRQLPSRLRRLDDALADLPLDEPMLLSELDGFLTGVIVSPDAILPGEWMQSVWGADDNGDGNGGGVAPFEDPLDVRWFADAVAARYAEIVRDLGRGKLQPIFDIDERNGDVLWELWIDGFAQAMDLRPDGWTPAGGLGDDGDAALSRLTLLVAVAGNESDLDSVEINALQDDAPGDIVDIVVRLHAARLHARGGVAAVPGTERPGKIGRNDPCPCGSGRKFKRCCGDTGVRRLLL